MFGDNRIWPLFSAPFSRSLRLAVQDAALSRRNHEFDSRRGRQFDSKYTDCVEVCPVDCFHEGPNFLVIDPEECIDCTLCEPECPAEAIYPEDDLPAGQEMFIEINAELSRLWPVITEQKEPPPDAEEWDGKPGKLDMLER